MEKCEPKPESHLSDSGTKSEMKVPLHVSVCTTERSAGCELQDLHIAYICGVFWRIIADIDTTIIVFA